MAKEQNQEPEFVAEARAENLKQEAAFFKAQASEAKARAVKAEAEAKVAQIQAEKATYEDRKRLAQNEFQHVFYYTDSVSSASVEACIQRLDLYNRLEPGCDIEIIFTSPGGDVIAGMRLFDHIQLIRRQGHKVTIGTTGYAASMAGILLQAGDHRWMGREAWVLIHQVQAGAMGSWGELTDRMDWLERIQDRILDIFAQRCKEAGENGTAKKPASRAVLKKNWSRKDWWLSSDEAVELGIVDEVR